MTIEIIMRNVQALGAIKIAFQQLSKVFSEIRIQLKFLDTLAKPFFPCTYSKCVHSLILTNKKKRNIILDIFRIFDIKYLSR